MDSRPRDTANAAWQLRQSIVAALSSDARLRVAIDLSDSIREIRIAGLLSRNPGCTRADAVRQLVITDTGVDLAQTR
jgi:hypothetical protein